MKNTIQAFLLALPVPLKKFYKRYCKVPDYDGYKEIDSETNNKNDDVVGSQDSIREINESIQFVN